MVLNDLVDSFCYSQKNAGLKGLKLVLQSILVLAASCFIEKPDTFYTRQNTHRRDSAGYLSIFELTLNIRKSYLKRSMVGLFIASVDTYSGVFL